MYQELVRLVGLLGWSNKSKDDYRKVIILKQIKAIVDKEIKETKKVRKEA